MSERLELIGFDLVGDELVFGVVQRPDCVLADVADLPASLESAHIDHLDVDAEWTIVTDRSPILWWPQLREARRRRVRLMLGAHSENVIWTQRTPSKGLSKSSSLRCRRHVALRDTWTSTHFCLRVVTSKDLYLIGVLSFGG